MNSRERFLAAVNHREPDRVPIDLGRHVGSLHRNAYLKLREYLADPTLQNEDKILDRMVQNVFPDEKLLRKLRFQQPGHPNDKSLQNYRQRRPLLHYLNPCRMDTCFYQQLLR